MELKLVCSSTENYMERIYPYLQTVNAFARIEAVLMTVGFEPDPAYFDELPNIKWRQITHEQNLGAPKKSHSIQHGSFLPLVSDDDHDVIIYTDGDIIMQRGFSNAEIGWLINCLDDQTVGVGWNSGPHEKLVNEAMRLHPIGDHAQTIGHWGEIIEREPCFNIGVMVAKASVWRRLYEQYMGQWEQAREWFGHDAWQQWTMCLSMAQLNLNRHILPYSFHTHAHYGLPRGTSMYNGIACSEDRIILFRHRF